MLEKIINGEKVKVWILVHEIFPVGTKIWRQAIYPIADALINNEPTYNETEETVIENKKHILNINEFKKKWASRYIKELILQYIKEYWDREDYKEHYSVNFDFVIYKWTEEELLENYILSNRCYNNTQIKELKDGEFLLFDTVENKLNIFADNFEIYELEKLIILSELLIK